MDYAIRKKNTEQFRDGEISRRRFCRLQSRLLGYDDSVGGHADRGVPFITYRGRSVRIVGGVLRWRDESGEHEVAGETLIQALRTTKNTIDMTERGASCGR